jgi:ribosome-associated protein
MTDDTSAKKDIQRLQRAIIDGLEDVKAQDIQVFNTEHLSPLFERVMVASGTSNRQTKALASSVRDAVREAGFPKPRIEGEENGEWIIVDCGAAVAHIMQPAIRTYYHLEEIWGDKPIRLKFGTPKPASAAPEPGPAKKAAPVKTSLRRSSAVKTAAREAKDEAEAEARQKALTRSRKTTGKSPARGAAKSSVAPAPSRAPASKAPASKSASGRSAPAKAPAKVPVKTVGKPPAKSPAKSAASTTAKKAPAAKKSPVAKAPAAKKAPAKSSTRKA